VSGLRIRNEELDWVEADEEIVALDLRSSSYLAANASATVLWKRLARGASRDALISELTRHFTIDQQQAADDVDAFLRQLDAAGLLTTT
jgi:hypothetical protein